MRSSSGDAEAAEKGDDSQVEGDGDENGESEEEKEDDPAVLPLQGPLHLPQEAAGYESPQGWHVLATGVSRLGDVKNAIRFVSVPGREVPTLQELRAWVGPFLFDGPIKIETEKDYANVMQEFEHFASSGSDQKLLTEHLTKMDIKGPRPKELLFENDLGTGPGASLLMESFRIAEEFKVQDLRSQGDCTDEEVFKRLFCLRFNCARPLHHMVGILALWWWVSSHVWGLGFIEGVNSSLKNSDLRRAMSVALHSGGITAAPSRVTSQNYQIPFCVMFG